MRTSGRSLAEIQIFAEIQHSKSSFLGCSFRLKFLEVAGRTRDKALRIAVISFLSQN